MGAMERRRVLKTSVATIYEPFLICRDVDVAYTQETRGRGRGRVCTRARIHAHGLGIVRLWASNSARLKLASAL